MKRPAGIFRFASEAAMCAAFVADARRQGWDAYPETGGFDIVLVSRDTKLQVGVEAKQQLNAKALAQAASGLSDPVYGVIGPDFRAVLVPDGGPAELAELAQHLGIVIIRARGAPDAQGWATWRNGICSYAFTPPLPARREIEANQDPPRWWCADHGWPQHCPAAPLPLPDYVPDVAAGAPAPVMLTQWKVRAIKICILLERRGYVTAKDFRSLGISNSRWLQGDWLRRGGGGRLVRGDKIPDFRAQHPRNYDEIAADFDRWSRTELEAEAAA